MSISQRDTLLNSLVDNITEYVNAGSDNYKIGVAEVVRGIHLYEDMANKPGICLWAYKDDKEDEMFGDSYIRNLFIKVYGYTETDGYTHDDIHKLARDMEYFLENDWTYKDQVYLGNMIIYEGGINDPVGIFELEIMVRYHTDKTNP